MKKIFKSIFIGVKETVKDILPIPNPNEYKDISVDKKHEKIVQLIASIIGSGIILWQIIFGGV